MSNNSEAKNTLLTWAGSEQGQVVLLTLAALLLRVVYAWFCKVPPWNDMLEWDKARLSILNGQPYYSNWVPLYPALLAAVTKVFGGSYFLINCVNSILSALSCTFTYLAAREIFGKKTALLALALSVFYVDTIWYASLEIAENMAIFMVSFLTWRFLKDRRYWLNGILLGLTCLTKGLFLGLLPGFLAWIYVREGAKAWKKQAVIFTGTLLLTLLPWTIRNFMVYKAPVLLEPHWASAVFAGHNPYATGGYDYTYRDHDYGKFDLDPSLTIVQKNRIYLRKALDFMLHNPIRELQLTLLRASKHLTFATSFVAYSAPYPARKFMFAASLLQNMALFPLCALGLIFSFRDRGAFGPAMIVVLLAGLFTTVFSANTRMRIPLVPAMITLAAHGALILPGLLRRLRAGNTGGIAGKLYASGTAIALLYLNFIYQVLTRYGNVAERFR